MTVTAVPMRTKIRKVRDAALTYAIVRPPEATRRTPITVSCPNSTGSPPGSRLTGQPQVNHKSTNSNPCFRRHDLAGLAGGRQPSARQRRQTSTVAVTLPLLDRGDGPQVGIGRSLPGAAPGHAETSGHRTSSRAGRLAQTISPCERIGQELLACSTYPLPAGQRPTSPVMNEVTVSVALRVRPIRGGLPCVKVLKPAIGVVALVAAVAGTMAAGGLSRGCRAAQAARRRTSQTVAAMSRTDSASSQPPSIHWNGQNRLPGW